MAALWEGNPPLVMGEEDEAVSKSVEELLGLSYERMKTAAVIQQGEPDRSYRSSLES